MTMTNNLNASGLPAANTILPGMPGAIISTETMAVDRRAAEEAHALSHMYGAEGAAILVALRRELGHSVGLDRIIELASLGDPAFRAACAAHLATLRKEAAAERAAIVFAQRVADHAHQRTTLNNEIDSAFTHIRRMRAEREHWEDMERAGRAGPMGISKEAYAERDAEIKKFEKRLVRARKALETWERAADDKKTATYDQLTSAKED